ncbi:MAG: hypothetical protein HYS09_10605 [Chloroflexi bacterium]|nr:hypothetical protein [Chloroflexota bacterium]
MTAEASCCVCGKALDGSNTAECNNCGWPFHLNRRNDVEGKDCGDVWINEQYLSLEFGCFNCLGNTEATGAEPPVGRGH